MGLASTLCCKLHASASVLLSAQHSSQVLSAHLAQLCSAPTGPLERRWLTGQKWYFWIQQSGREQNLIPPAPVPSQQTWAFLRARMGIRLQVTGHRAPLRCPSLTPWKCSLARSSSSTQLRLQPRLADQKQSGCRMRPSLPWRMENAIHGKTRMAGEGRCGREWMDGVGRRRRPKEDLDPHRRQEPHEKRTIMKDPQGKWTNKRYAAHFSFPAQVCTPSTPLTSKHSDSPTRRPRGSATQNF
jgi:hypothetical protein